MKLDFDTDAGIGTRATLGVIVLETDVPVISSNQALAWHMLRLAGVDDAMPNFGALFS